LQPNHKASSRAINKNESINELKSNTMNSQTDQDIIRYSKELRMPVFRRDFKQLAQEAAIERINYEEFLLRLIQREFEARAENRKKVKIRQAEFPAKMYLNDLVRDQLPTDANEKLSLLERLDFIVSGQNIVLAGNPGTGKTHIATGLGLKACMQGYKVMFTTVHKLLTQIRESTPNEPLGS